MKYAGKLTSLDRSWQSKGGVFRALGTAGIERTPTKSSCDWTPGALTFFLKFSKQTIFENCIFLEKNFELRKLFWEIILL
jgi:hypothetical protein